MKNVNVTQEQTHIADESTNQIDEKMNSVNKHQKVKSQFTNFNHKLKSSQIMEKINEFKTHASTPPSSYTELIQRDQTRIHINWINKFTTVFASAVVVGLSVGMLLMAKPAISAENFDNEMQSNIEAAFLYDVTELNTQNDNITYHVPHQFKYLTSLGVNDIIKYKDNQIIMHYNNQYNIIGQDIDTYYLLREENKVAGEEVFYKNFNYDQNNGFVQLVEMNEKYLLTVFVDGIKLSAIVDYAETPFMTYSMLLMGKTVNSYEPMYVKNTQTQTASVSEEANASRAAEPETKEIASMKIDEFGQVSTEVIEGQLSTVESEHVFEFDFSSESRGEFTDVENTPDIESGESANEGN